MSAAAFHDLAVVFRYAVEVLLQELCATFVGSEVLRGVVLLLVRISTVLHFLNLLVVLSDFHHVLLHELHAALLSS